MDDRSRLNLGFNNSPPGERGRTRTNGWMDGRTDGRKNLGGESRVANNCCGVESAFCNPAEVSIESFGYFRRDADPRDILNFRFKIAIIFAEEGLLISQFDSR